MKAPRHNGRSNNGRSCPLRARFLLPRSESMNPAFSRTANCCQKRTVMKNHPNIQTCRMSKANAKKIDSGEVAPAASVRAIPSEKRMSKEKTTDTKTHSEATHGQNLTVSLSTEATRVRHPIAITHL